MSSPAIRGMLLLLADTDGITAEFKVKMGSVRGVGTILVAAQIFNVTADAGSFQLLQSATPGGTFLPIPNVDPALTQFHKDSVENRTFQFRFDLPWIRCAYTQGDGSGNGSLILIEGTQNEEVVSIL